MNQSINAQIQKLFETYNQSDNFKKVLNFLEEKGDNWDKVLISNNGETIENLTAVLVYEYAYATEKITKGKITFQDALNRLKGVGKFRLGEPKNGDENIIYGKSLIDSEAMSIMSEEYNERRITTGAQEAQYVDEKGEIHEAVLLFSKKQLPNGKWTAGLNEEDLSDIRQTAFHEWNHNAEQQKITENNELLEEYSIPDGRKFSNVTKITHYRKPEFEDGKFKGMSKELYPVNRPYSFSTGLVTRDIDTGEMYNMITEGFVELFSREMVKVIDPNSEIDESKYYEQTNIANIVTTARDQKKGEGKTAADFLGNSIMLKRELEGIQVEGKDALHYLADYARDAWNGNTPKKQFMRNFEIIACDLNLSGKQISEIKESDFWCKNEFSDKEIEEIKEKFSPNEENSIVERCLKGYIEKVNEEQDFFNSIPEKLGYQKKEFSLEEQK